MLPIRTERLTLRPVEPGDVDAMHAYKSQPDVVRYVPHGPLSRDEVVEWIATRARTDLTDEGQALPLAVIERESGQMIGDVVLFWRSKEHQRGEIGYILDPRSGGHGYAAEAARALLRFGFEEIGLHRITAVLDARNDASARLLERIGMRREAHHLQDDWFKGEWSDTYIYAMLAEEWHA
jgi:RimJ/RimL family protein N-acetyltransferase